MVNLPGNFRMPWTKRRGAQDWPNSGSDTRQTRLFCKPEVHAAFQWRFIQMENFAIKVPYIYWI